MKTPRPMRVSRSARKTVQQVVESRDSSPAVQQSVESQDFPLSVLLGMRFAGRRRRDEGWHSKTSLPKPLPADLLPPITVDGGSFPRTVRDHLLRLMTDKRDRAGADTFMHFCETAVDFAKSEHLRQPKAAECAQIESVAAHLRKALVALWQMPPETRWLVEQGAYLLATSDPDRPPRLAAGTPYPAALLPQAWDFISRLEDAATMALNFGPVTNRDRDDEERAKSLAWFVTMGYEATYGRLPPGDSKGWFAPFMRELGKHAGIACGPRIVSAMVESVERENAVK